MADISPSTTKTQIKNKTADTEVSKNIRQQQIAVNREFQEKDTVRRAHELDLPYINIGKTILNPDVLKLVTKTNAKESMLIPFFRLGKKLRVAVQDPNSPATQKVVNTLIKKGYEVSQNLASEAGIKEALKAYQEQAEYKKLKIVKKVDTSKLKTYEKEIKELADLPTKLKTITAEEALNLLNISAMNTGASDIHLEPSEKAVGVRFRIDGILHTVFDLPTDVYSKISNQIKYKSKMRLNVTTVPQDGRYDFSYNDKKIDVRVSSIPTPYGESMVCRLLSTDENKMSFEDLGFQGLALKKLEHTVKISHGMILVTGPTGSGKTTTLYAILQQMKSPYNKIITLEDPVEYRIDGVTQSQIDEKHNYDFAGGLRSLLRHDPDVVMLGEIRDIETAEVASQAALTGHVLLSTLHTNSAIESIPRLVNMGLPPFMVAPAIDTIVAQRLVRKVCPKCSEKRPITDSEKEEFEVVVQNLKNINPNLKFEIPKELVGVKGCAACSHTGYQGRLVIAEVVTVGEQMKNMILKKSSSVDLISLARKEGMLTMREDGFMKAAQGLTTLEEVHRVTNVSI